MTAPVWSNRMNVTLTAVDDRYAALVSHFRGKPDIDVGKMFGSPGLRVGGKSFAMLVKGALVAKLPASRCRELVAAGVAEFFDPGHGRVMKEWVRVANGTSGDWRMLGEQALQFTAQGAGRKRPRMPGKKQTARQRNRTGERS